MTDVDLRTEVGSVRLKNPVLLASGTAGYGEELSRWIPLDAVGGIITKGTSLEPWPGNPTPRTVETPAGMLNSIGLENPGVEAVLRHHLPALAQVDTRVIVNIVGRSVEEYAAVARALSLSPRVDALEVNISCPNVKAGGMSFGTDPEQAAAVVRAVRAATSLPIWVKLSPNVTDIVAMARAVAAAGANALSLINTLVGMVIDTRLRRP
ncbi:MAG: dihydroorotate dehydrogenase, partial [Firmicutes bacterium]|nr:dihydroorotate dehydrogenase [Bacillota bacterium]